MNNNIIILRIELEDQRRDRIQREGARAGRAIDYF
jgi:hypothetical protein